MISDFFKVKSISPQSSQHYGNSHVIWITRFYLPPDRGDVPAITLAEAGTRSSTQKDKRPSWLEPLGANILLKGITRLTESSGWDSNPGFVLPITSRARHPCARVHIVSETPFLRGAVVRATMGGIEGLTKKVILRWGLFKERRSRHFVRVH